MTPIGLDSAATAPTSRVSDMGAWLDTAAPRLAPASVFIADDEAGCSRAARGLLADAGYDVRTTTLSDIAAGAVRERFGCVIVDLDTTGVSGHDVPALLASWRCGHPVILLSGRATIPQVIQALRAGVADFVTKPVDARALLGVVDEVIARHQLADAAARILAGRRARFDLLSTRERQVALGIARGQLNKQVAHDLGLTLATIKFHRARAMAKLGVRCVPELVLLLKSLDMMPTPIGPVTTR